MNRKVFLIGAVAGFVVAMAFAVVAYMVSTTGVIPRDVVAGGGGRSAASSYVLNATVGQPFAAVSAAGNGTTLYGGFQTPALPATAARNWELY